MSKQTVVTQHYFDLNGYPITLHYYGGYMAYTTEGTDVLSSLKRLRPFTSIETYRVKVGERPRIEVVYDRHGNRDNVIVQDPVFEDRFRDTTPDYKPKGKPIQVGDKVTAQMDSLNITGILAELTDTHACVDVDNGDNAQTYYFPWSTGPVRITRA